MQGSKENSLDISNASASKSALSSRAPPQATGTPLGPPPGMMGGPPINRMGPPPGMGPGASMAMPDMSGLQNDASQRLMSMASAQGEELSMRVAAREQEIKSLSLLNEQQE